MMQLPQYVIQIYLQLIITLVLFSLSEYFFC